MTDSISRRQLLKAFGAAAVGAPIASALAQGRCMRTFGIPSCDTTSIKPIFAPTGWQTVSLDHLVFSVADYQKEAAFYEALMGWSQRSDDGKQAVMDIGTWGTVIFRQGDFPPAPADDAAAPGGNTPAGGRGGRGGAARAPARAVVESMCWGITPWNARTVAAELRKRGLQPVADNDGHGFESFHIKDPDGFDVQISNGAGARRRNTSNAPLAAPSPFERTGWKTVWLDHLSFGVTNYKLSTSFYTNLLGWTPTYDEGSQNECMIGDIGDVIIRGGNPLDPNFGRGGAGRGGRGAAAGRQGHIDHISFGIDPWDTDGVKAALDKRGLPGTIDTSSGDEIHSAPFKSYHTRTPNGYNLQISAVHHDTRLSLANAVRPKRPAGG